jgi:hypothetical protein
MNKNTLIIGLVAIIAIGAGVIFVNKKSSVAVSNFEECAKAGNPIMESYPRQCRSKDGQTFREDVGGQLEMDNVIRVSSPLPNATITSPFVVKGMARGNWFFEASFPFKLINSEGKEIPMEQGFISAGSDWMTTEFVPFEKSISFPPQKPGKGTLILMKDNPSGLPQNDKQLEIPVIFK